MATNRPDLTKGRLSGAQLEVLQRVRDGYSIKALSFSHTNVGGEGYGAEVVESLMMRGFLDDEKHLTRKGRKKIGKHSRNKSFVPA
ncbi:MAG: hypothetical protein WDZ90_02460 [Candidatus Paceibacterota bacterium]